MPPFTDSYPTWEVLSGKIFQVTTPLGQTAFSCPFFVHVYTIVYSTIFYECALWAHGKTCTTHYGGLIYLISDFSYLTVLQRSMFKLTTLPLSHQSLATSLPELGHLIHWHFVLAVMSYGFILLHHANLSWDSWYTPFLSIHTVFQFAECVVNFGRNAFLLEYVINGKTSCEGWVYAMLTPTIHFIWAVRYCYAEEHS